MSEENKDREKYSIHGHRKKPRVIIHHEKVPCRANSIYNVRTRKGKEVITCKTCLRMLKGKHL